MSPALRGVGLVVGALALGAAYLAHAAQHGAWQVDDAGISFAYARNLAEGWGPVTNPGDTEPNEGWSNPAWTFLVAALIAVGAFDLVVTPKVLSVGFTLASFVGLGAIVHRLLGDDRPSAWTLLPTAALVVNGSFVVWSIGGLENPQYVAALALALWAYLGDVRDLGRLPRSGPAFFLVAISRPEGLAYTFAVGVDALVRAGRARAWRWLAGLVGGLLVLLVPYLVGHLVVFGDLLPNTYYAKARDLPFVVRLLDPRTGGWRYLIEGSVVWPQAGLLLLVPLALVDRQAWRHGLGAVVAALGASVLFVLQSGGDWMMEYRFLSPFYAWVAVLAAVGAATLGRLVVPSAAGRAAAVALALGAVAACASALPEGLRRMLAAPTVPLEDRLSRLPKLLAVTDALGIDKPLLLMSDMGGPMWANPDGRARILDLFGLCDRHIAHALHDRDVERMWTYAFHAHTPAAVQVPPTLYDQWKLAAFPHFLDAFTPLDDAGGPRREARWFVRRELVEAPWDERFVSEPVVVQDRVRVHGVRLVEAAPGRAVVELDTSLRRAGPRPSVRLVLRGAGEAVRAVELLPFLDPRALVPDRVLRTRATVELPAELGVPTAVAALGVPEPSDLPPPPRWAETPLDLAGTGTDWLARGWLLAQAGDVAPGPSGAVYAPADVARQRLCTPAIPVGPGTRLRTTLAVALPALADDVTLDVRGLDADGAFAGRAAAWRFPVPRPEATPLALELPIPEGSHGVRLCLTSLGGSPVTLAAWSVARLDP